jgi:hypothetical protein
MATYREIHSQVQTLTAEEQLCLLEELAGMLRYRISTKPKQDIMALEGLGKEIWQGLDAQAYVDQERDSMVDFSTGSTLCRVVGA